MTTSHEVGLPSDCAKRARGKNEAEYDPDPYAAGVDRKLGRPFPPAGDDPLAHARRGQLADGPPQCCRADDCKAPPGCSGNRGQSDEGQQRDTERHDDVAERTEGRAVGYEQDQRAECGEARADSDSGKTTLPTEAPLQVDDATRYDAPPARLGLGRR